MALFQGSAARLPVIHFRLANGMVGRPYQHPLQFESSPGLANQLEVEAISGLSDLGLQFSQLEQQVVGIPNQAGEHLLKLSYRLGRQSACTRSVVLLINPDPASLWRQRPADPTIPGWKADIDCQSQMGAPGWQLMGVSCRGRSHAHQGACREDDVQVFYDSESGWHLLAVADGAGSAPLARSGSRLAVQTSIQALSRGLRTIAKAEIMPNQLALLFSQAVSQAVEAIAQAACQAKTSVRDFDSTLLLAAHRVCAGRHFFSGYQVGDGGMVLYSAASGLMALGQGDHGTYAGETCFLTPEAADLRAVQARLRSVELTMPASLILMTDGLTDPLFANVAALSQQRAWQPLWQQCLRPRLGADLQETSRQLLSWLDFQQVGHHDDRTLALLYHDEVLDDAEKTGPLS